MQTKADFKEELAKRLRCASQGRLTAVDINAGELHRAVGGYPGRSHRMPICCAAMREEMRAGDEGVTSPASGYGASLTIRYLLPR